MDNFDPYNAFFGYCYKYTCATYDCFCAPGSQITFTYSDIYNIANLNCLTVYFSIVSLTYYYDFY